MPLLLILLLPLSVFGGCGAEAPSPGPAAPPAAEETPREPLTIRLEGGDWGYPSPFTHYPRGPGIFKMQLIFDSLLERAEDGYVPWLAENWEVSEDAETYLSSPTVNSLSLSGVRGNKRLLVEVIMSGTKLNIVAHHTGGFNNVYGKDAMGKIRGISRARLHGAGLGLQGCRGGTAGLGAQAG